MKEKSIQDLMLLAHQILSQPMENADFSALKQKALSIYENLTIAEHLHKVSSPVMASVETISRIQTPPPAMPQSTVIEKVTPQNPITQKTTVTSLEDILSQVPSDPIFEEKSLSKDTPVKTLNDVINTQTFQIGLNDRIAFISHLFEGNEADFSEAVEALKKQPSADVALRFIQEKIKPVFNNWEGKEEYEERFVNIILRKFN